MKNIEEKMTMAEVKHIVLVTENSSFVEDKESKKGELAKTEPDSELGPKVMPVTRTFPINVGG